MRLSSRPGCHLFVVLLAFALLVGCSDDDDSGAGGDGGTSNATGGGTTGGTTGGGTTGMDAGMDTGEAMDTGEEDSGADAEEEVSVMCEPNSIIRCLVENTPSIEQCNFRGNMIVTTTCPGRAVCREGECVDVECIPGTRVCQDDVTPLRCNDEGSEFEAQPTCEEGALCSDGACLSPCTIAEESSSYIGCEYVAVELDNALLYDEDDTSTPEAPFAVVLSNPNAEPTRVTVYAPNGDVMESIPEVYIPVGLVDPRFTATTVYTEILDTNGERVGEPIEGRLEGVEMPPGSQMQVIFPRGGPTPLVSSLTRTAWKLVADRPVVAYQFNPICCNYSFTNDASLLLPTSALTENYWVMSYPTWTPRSDTSYPATLTVVASEDNTEVTVTLSDPRIRQGMGVPQPDENGQLSVILQAQEVLNIEASSSTPEVDLTGSVVAASS